MKKKFLSVMLCAVTVAALTTGCGAKKEEATTAAAEATTVATEATTEASKDADAEATREATTEEVAEVIADEDTAKKAEELIKNCMKSDEYFEGKMVMDINMQMTMDMPSEDGATSSPYTLDMAVKADMDVTSCPDANHTKGTMYMNMLGMEQNTVTETYNDYVENKLYSYTEYDGSGSWYVSDAEPKQNVDYGQQISENLDLSTATIETNADGDSVVTANLNMNSQDSSISQFTSLVGDKASDLKAVYTIGSDGVIKNIDVNMPSNISYNDPTTGADVNIANFSIDVIYTSFDESITVTVPDDVKASATATEIDE